MTSELMTSESPSYDPQAWHGVPVIAMQGVERVYPGPPAVRALSLTDLAVNVGEYVAVVGPSGSGKSTLLNVIGLLDRPSRGTYEFCGLDTAALLDGERAAVRGREIGFVFQTPYLLPHRTALENVMLALAYGGAPRGTRHAEAAEALEHVGFGHRAHALARTLSCGERQCVAVARALAGRPTVLLCDEPTGNLDCAAAAAILDLLDRLHGDGTTVLVVTHDPAVAARAQRTVPIRGGSLALGRPAAVLDTA